MRENNEKQLIQNYFAVFVKILDIEHTINETKICSERVF